MTNAADVRPNGKKIGRRRRRLRTTALVLTIAGLLGFGVAAALYVRSRPTTYRPGEEMTQITRGLARGLPDDAPAPALVDVTAEVGLGEYVAFAGARSSQLPEDMGPGAAWGDFDDDGDDDLFLVGGGAALDRPIAERAPSILYENVGGNFRRVTDFPETRILGLAAAWADVDGDGRIDLAVSGYDSLLLFRNTKSGFVHDATFPAPRGFWAGLAWGDFDNDSDLDLYVCGYVQYAADADDRARSSPQYGEEVPFTLNPASYRPAENLLLQNDGKGQFTDVARQLGVANPEGRSLAAVWHDFDQDGWLDLYVANDISDNVFYRNLGDGRFQDVSHAAWVADYRGAMGLAVGDWNRDGDDDLFVTHWVAQENALYDSLLRDLPRGGTPSDSEPRVTAAPVRFVDVADQRGLGQIALRVVGWGAEFADLDADGWLDLAVANGSTFETQETPRGLRPERSFLFWNRRGEFFHDLAPAVPALAEPLVARGLAIADYDADGDLDLLLVRRDRGALLLRNDMRQGRSIQLRLTGRGGSRGEGAIVTARAGETLLRRAVTHASYLSQSSAVLHFGLGEADTIDALEVRWPGGETATYGPLDAGGRYEVIQGDTATGRTAAPVAATPPPDARAQTTEFWAKHRAAMSALKVDQDLPRAIVLFREALALDPEHEDARYYLAQCLTESGDRVGAREQLDLLLRRNATSHRALKQLGRLLAGSPNERDAAAAVLERALAVNPEETGALLLLAEIDLLRGNREAARQRLEWVTRTNPRAAGALFLRAYVAWKAGDAPRATELLQATRAALGDEWQPSGTTAEGDVQRKMHADATPLSPFWEAWDGTDDTTRAFAALDAHLRSEGSGAARR